jgi:WD40 repeat protein
MMYNRREETVMKWKLIITILLLAGAVRAHAEVEQRLAHQIPVDSKEITAMEISRDGRFLACGVTEGGVYVRDTESGKQLLYLEHHKKAVSCLAFDSKAHYLVSGSHDEKIAVWDLLSGELVCRIDDFKDKVRHVEVSPGDNLLAACGSKKEINVWEFPSGSIKGKLRGHKKDVLLASFNAAGSHVISVGKDKLLIVWDLNTLAPVRRNEIHAQTMVNSGIDVTSAAFSADRDFLAVGISEHVLAKGGKQMKFRYNIAFYDWKNGALIKIIEGNAKTVDHLIITPDKEYAITDNVFSRNPQYSYWDIHDGVTAANHMMEGDISALTFSPNGEWLAAAWTKSVKDAESSINLWKVDGIAGYSSLVDTSMVPFSSGGFGSVITLSHPGNPLIRSGNPRTIAVLYFKSEGIQEGIARSTTHLLENRLLDSPYVTLLERNEIDAIIEELNYASSGLTDSQSLEIGKHLEAEHILLGRIDKMGNDLIINARLINVETRQNEGMREARCQNASLADIYEMIARLAPTIASSK